MSRQYLSLSCLFLLMYSLSASAEDKCPAAEILRPDVVKYDTSALTFLAYNHAVDQLVRKGQSTGVGVRYDGFDLSYNDAQNIASMYSSRTNTVLSQDASVSLISSEIPPDNRKAFLDCIRAASSDIEIFVKPGAFQKQSFQGTIEWHPTYTVDITDAEKDEREVNIVTTNGTVEYGERLKLRPNQNTLFQIDRLDLDLPFYMTAYIDKRASEQFEFPARPESTIAIELRTLTTDVFRRSGHYGPEAADWGPFCIYPQKGGIMLPSTAVPTKSGSGYDFDRRTEVKISSSRALETCIIVHSGGVPDRVEKYGHQVQGTLSVAEAFVRKLKY
ncbi:hypothetical protein [Mesorhizobium sp. M0276]|uniref:hypothetical protein n=1 Tax=Mesorhizobium sp. M0276 TaxID=2956928 RepID=UPI00333D5790